MTFEPTLPKGWATTTIRQLSRPVKQVSPATLGRDAFEYIEVSGLNNAAHAIFSTATTPTASAPSRARQLVEGGDIIFSSVRVYLENIAIVPEELAGEIASTAFCVVRAMPGVSSRYLFHFLTWQKTIRALTERQRGNSPPAINEAEFFDYEVTLAPSAEQARIVSRVEELFSDLDKGEESLRRAQAQLKRYRQSVLKAAVTGELTRAWREQNADKLESGEALLKRILKARRETWEQAESEKLRAKGKRPKDNAWKSRYVEPQGPDTEGLPELPQGWAWATVEILADYEKSSLRDGPFGSNLKSEHYVDDGPRVIRLQNVGDGQFIDEQAHISEAHYAKLQTHCVHGGDIIIAALGSPLPRACVVPDSVGPAINKADCVRYRTNPEFANKDTVLCALNSVVIRNHIAKIVHGIGRPRINLAEIKAIPIPVASLAEQEVIADAVASVFSNIAALEKELTARLGGVKQLRQSILKAAFSGTLVPQDPNDEPAEELLKRIAAERAAQGARPAKSAAPRAPRKVRAAAQPSASAPAAPSAAVSGLAAARKAAGLSQAQLAAATGINQAYVSQMETGKRAMTADQAAAIAKALGVEPSAFTQE
ncbi:MAG: helix-turn-helix domain-containing protein [Desulfovibrio aminophilus]|uniref:helix-turn-helix domain-containing protein n=1 Tax=Desulfovibrio aminophilus TaxID=81425 RepID=UPI0039EB3571